jgi:uracil-DNA glycosylase family 4
MGVAELSAELRRYLKQRLELGERVVILPKTRHADAPAAAVTPEAGRTRAAALAPAAGLAPAAPLTPQAALALGAARTQKDRSAAKVPPPLQGTADRVGREAAAVDSLEQIAAEVRACTRCRLHQTRTQAVPGVGPEKVRLVCVGEGPGADEDRQGEPFVGRAGQLLNKILAAVKLQREEVYITNIVKCRPPENRDPEPDEVAACRPFLERQLRLLEPRVICALGRHAASALLGTQESLSKLRAGQHFYGGIRVFPTYHPAALLRNPQWKRPVWEDIQKVRQVVDADP